MVDSPVAYELVIDEQNLVDIETWEPVRSWYTLMVNADSSLEELAGMILTVFRWEEDHLYEFEIDGKRFADPDFRLENTESSYVPLRSVIARPRMRFKFVYDFGEEHEYSIKVRHILKKIPRGVALPVCVETGLSIGTPNSVTEINSLLVDYVPRS